MLNPFPELLTYALLAPVFLRCITGFFFIYFGWNKLTKEREHRLNFFESVNLRPAGVYLTLLGILQIVVGIFLIVGLGTQIAAIIVAIITFISYIIKLRQPSMLPSSLGIYALLFFIAISLLFSGAGIPAIDLPL